MGHRVSPTLTREHMNFVERPLSVSYASSKLCSRYVAEDYEIRAMCEKNLQKHLMSKIIIERISSRALLIRIVTHFSNMLVGPNSQHLEKLRAMLVKRFKTSYTDIQVGIVSGGNPDTDASAICRKISHAIEISNGRNYMRTVRQIAEQVNRQVGLLGILIIISGRINGGTIASKQKVKQGIIKAQSVKYDVIQSIDQAMTKTGAMGVRVILQRVLEDRSRDMFEEPSNNRRPRRFEGQGDRPRFNSRGGRPPFNRDGPRRFNNDRGSYNGPRGGTR